MASTSSPLKDKTLIWHLYQAAIAGRDIYYDQRYAHALDMRDTFEAILTNSATVDKPTLDAIQKYAKLFWVNTGPYNNLTERKFLLDTTPEAFAAAAKSAETARSKVSDSQQRIPRRPARTPEAHVLRQRLRAFRHRQDSRKRSRHPHRQPQQPLFEASLSRTSPASKKNTASTPASSKQNGKLVEQVYKVGGLYDAQLKEINTHLEAAANFATEPMAKALRALAQWYRTGEPEDRKAYDIAWVADNASPVDTINGFTEVYLDARGVKGSWNPSSSSSIPLKQAASRNSRRTPNGLRTTCRGTPNTARPA